VVNSKKWRWGRERKRGKRNEATILTMGFEPRHTTELRLRGQDNKVKKGRKMIY
jgi:hypothetical protein